MTPDDLFASSFPPAIPAPIRNEPLLAELAKTLRADQVSDAAEMRLRRGHGHSLEEMWAIKHGRVARVPDLVVWPENDAEVEAIVLAALRHEAVLVPYGGGTNVIDALRCPADEARCIVSVDMARMNRVLWIDPVNRMACIQAGAVGRQIAATLARHGFTMGHEPDSVEFSTLGGSIALETPTQGKERALFYIYPSPERAERELPGIQGFLKASGGEARLRGQTVVGYTAPPTPELAERVEACV